MEQNLCLTSLEESWRSLDLGLVLVLCISSWQMAL
jgi:hypothetical protein